MGEVIKVAGTTHLSGYEACNVALVSTAARCVLKRRKLNGQMPSVLCSRFRRVDDFLPSHLITGGGKSDNPVAQTDDESDAPFPFGVDRWSGSLERIVGADRWSASLERIVGAHLCTAPSFRFFDGQQECVTSESEHARSGR